MKNIECFVESFLVGKNDIVQSVLVKIVRLSLNKVHKFLCHSV